MQQPEPHAHVCDCDECLNRGGGMKVSDFKPRRTSWTEMREYNRSRKRVRRTK